jgi:hypothetical protein
MDSLIAAAARALAAGDALGALKRVALRDDPPAKQMLHWSNPIPDETRTLAKTSRSLPLFFASAPQLHCRLPRNRHGTTVHIVRRPY